MRIEDFSKKQLEALTWWAPASADRDKTAIICDGAVRSGKTMCLGISFVLWAMAAMGRGSFAICGKTIRGVRRNLLSELVPFLAGLGYSVREQVSQNLITVSKKRRSCRFYLFGGKDEGSAALIQGMTLSGVLFDEVALMPRSFVEQALARCSVKGARFWFNCNPEHPGHWFYQEWILQPEKRNALYLHFTMDDNPSLAPEVRARYQKMFTGVFRQRFIEGKWVAAQGLVYPFAGELLCDVPEGPFEDFAVSCDYGTMNPTSFGLWALKDGCWYRIREAYYDGRESGVPRTDEEHYRSLLELCGDDPVRRITVDPSAASFIAVVRRHRRFQVIPAKNDVLTGIRETSAALKEEKIRVCKTCKDAAREFSLYRWKEGTGRDEPVKEFDHAMDDMRYFVSTLLGRKGGSAYFAAARRR